MKLIYPSSDRSNNFNLIRMSAAIAVLVSHSFAVCVGSNSAEPFQDILGMTISGISVDVFFIISGYLVTSSILNKKHILTFIAARALRLVPALMVMLLATVFLLGPVFTNLPLTSYFSRSETYIYLVKCMSLLMEVEFYLPGVFCENPYRCVVNASLWTIPHEARMYCLLGLIWFLSGFAHKSKEELFRVTVVTVAFVSAVYVFSQSFLGDYPDRLISFCFMFFTGSSFYSFKNRIPLSKFIFFILIIGLFFSAGKKANFYVVYHFSIAYIVLFMAYMPSRFLRRYNALGDYSYGTYLYAFPVQQSIIALAPSISVVMMIFISLAVSFMLAVISWHLVEKRSIGFKINHR